MSSRVTEETVFWILLCALGGLFVFMASLQLITSVSQTHCRVNAIQKEYTAEEIDRICD